MKILRRILDGVWRWTWYSEEKGMDFNGYAARTPDGVVFIDPAYAEEEAWNELAELGPAAGILLTNKDHERASDALRARLKTEVWIHEADASLLNVKPERTFKDGQLLFGALEAVRFQRLKSPGECALHWKERRLLFIGDAVTGHPKGSLGLVKKHLGQPAVFEDLNKLLALDFDALLMGDGEPFLSGGKAALESFLAAGSRIPS